MNHSIFFNLPKRQMSDDAIPSSSTVVLLKFDSVEAIIIMNSTPIVIAAMIDHQNSHFTHGSAFRPHIHSFHRNAYIAIEMKVTGIILNEIFKPVIKNLENIKPEDINVLNEIDSTCTSNIVKTRVQGTLSKIDNGSAVIKYADSNI